MTTPRATPTLVVFTLGAAREARRHPLLPSRFGAAERALREKCLSEVLAAGRATGCRLLVCSPEPLAPADAQRAEQHGDDFGSRLRAALETAFAEADGPVLIVGTDIPGLSASHLRQALQALEDDPGSVVLGPSPDGGIYLLAARRPLDAVLAATRWCDHGTRRSLRRALADAGRPVTLLSPLVDLDSPRDLEVWLRRLRLAGAAGWRTLAGTLLRLLSTWRRPPLRWSLGSPATSPVRIRAGRAPPLPRRV